MTTASREEILDPGLPIIDAHHHLWKVTEAEIDARERAGTIVSDALAAGYRERPRYLLDEFLADAASGHDVIASVYMAGNAMYRRTGPVELRSTGEIEFANGIGAMAASGAFGDIAVCAGIVGSVDLRLGDRVQPVLDAHLEAGGARYRGIRSPGVHDDDPAIIGTGTAAHDFALPGFRTGFARLSATGLSFDAFVLEPQLPDVIDLARAFPETSIMLNHLGCPIGVGRYAGRLADRFPLWLASMRELAACENVSVKLGGIGNPFSGFPSLGQGGGASSEQLAAEWAPYIETCIESFGVDRCMFESNYPVDAAVGSYVVLWNTFKRITAGASRDEKTALFSGTAARVYRLDLVAG